MYISACYMGRWNYLFEKKKKERKNKMKNQLYRDFLEFLSWGLLYYVWLKSSHVLGKLAWDFLHVGFEVHKQNNSKK